MKKTLKISGFAGAVVLTGGALSPGLAHALTCATDVVRAPLDGDAAVPTDALLWGYARRSTGPGGV